MRIPVKYFVIVLSLCLTLPLISQTKKPKIRLSVRYVKEMNHAKYLILSARFKENKKFIPAATTKFFIYQILKKDSTLLIAKAKLDKHGRAKIKLQKNIDTDNLNFSIKLLDTISFKPLNKKINIKDADLIMSVIRENNKDFIIAVLTDSKSKIPLGKLPLKIQVKRTFKNLNIGEKELYFTDNAGSVKLFIPKGIPAINGILNLNASLNDNSTYGTVKAFTVTPLGTTIKEDTSFDDRSLFSARGKEPMFLFFISVSLAVIVWTAIIKVVYNIYKIYKS